jgi:hypothetical protein
MDVQMYHVSLSMQGVSLSTTSSMAVQVLYPSTYSSMYLQGVSLSITISMYVQGVSLSTPSSMYLFPPPIPELIDPVFAKTSPKRSFSIVEKELFWACFCKNWFYKNRAL